VRRLGNTKDSDGVRYFDQDESGNFEELDGVDEFAESFAGLENDPKFQPNFGADLRGFVETLKSSGAFEGQKINVDGFVKEMEEMMGDTKDVGEMHEKLRLYTKAIESQIDNEANPTSILDDVEDLNELDLDPTVAQEVQESRALRRSPIPQIPEHLWTKSQRRRIVQLNAILERITRTLRRGEELNEKTLTAAWKAYGQARPSLTPGWAVVPTDVWHLLWKAFSEGGTDKPSRLSRTAHLARDMSAAKVALGPSQQLLTIEAMFVDGWEKNATDNWKRCMSTLGEKDATSFQAFWELGVRMWCQLGQLDEAKRAMDKLLSRQCDPRIIIPFIRSCADKGTEDGRTMSWDAYRKLRELLGPDMVIDDYDKVISIFLATNQTENALYAFVDMMTAGQIDLKGMRHLPSVVANKFFVGKWLKRLIGAGELDGAHSVLRFMGSKGVEAAPIQINGLIGAWQRSGGVEDQKKAEDIAWEMVQSRINFVRTRNRFAGANGLVRIVGESPSADSYLPRATLETFCLLAENYRSRQQHGRLLELWDAFREAEISPDAFMMNQLLESYIQDGNTTEALKFYQSLVYDRQVLPDSYTFMFLWKMLGANRVHVISSKQREQDIHLARETFAEMVKFQQVFLPEGMDGQLGRKVLHTFRRLKDNAGLVLALKALRDSFHYLPTDAMALEMVLGTTNLAWDTPRTRQKLRIAKRHIDNDIAERQKQLGGTVQSGDEREQILARGQELSEYLQRYFTPEQTAPEEGRLALENAASEMGLYHIVE
jgi:hypothetical protein